MVYPSKAEPHDFEGRFREILCDPINLLIERVPLAGTLDAEGRLYLHNGNRVAAEGSFAYYGAFSRILVLNRGVHEPLEEYAFQEVLRTLGERPMMLELGAYWAHYSMWLKCRHPLATTVMVEPSSENIAVGKHNFTVNGYTGEFVQELVGRGHFSVDRFCFSRGIVKLDILHADIQGAEIEMLNDCQESLARRSIDYVFVSTHSQSLHNGVTDLLRGAGYRIELSSDHESETTAHDGLVFATSPGVPELLPNLRPLGRIEIAASSSRDLVESLLLRVGQS